MALSADGMKSTGHVVAGMRTNVARALCANTDKRRGNPSGTGQSWATSTGAGGALVPERIYSLLQLPTLVGQSTICETIACLD